jgi:hypothetical protein
MGINQAIEIVGRFDEWQGNNAFCTEVESKGRDANEH